MSTVEERLEALEARQRAHGEIIVVLENAAVQVHQMAEVVTELQELLPEEVDTVRAWRNPRWWTLAEEMAARDNDKIPEDLVAELGRLKGWVKQVGEPLLGLTRLPECYLLHMPVVLIIDALSELFRCLYFPEKRTKATVAAQNDLLLRILPAAKAEIHKVLTGCDHQSGLGNVRKIGGVR